MAKLFKSFNWLINKIIKIDVDLNKYEKQQIDEIIS